MGNTNQTHPATDTGMTVPVVEAIRATLLSPPGGLVGLVDELLALGGQHSLQLAWQADACSIHSFGGPGAETAVSVPLRRSVFRAILARIASVLNEAVPDSVSPYGGQGQVGGVRVAFVNTASEQRLTLTRVPATAPTGTLPALRAEQPLATGAQVP